ncbi:hypothetical protein PHYBOEH_010937, partial [Phytophthora boehmeriae]
MSTSFGDDTEAFEAALNFLNEYDDDDVNDSTILPWSEAIGDFSEENLGQEAPDLTLLPLELARHNEFSNTNCNLKPAVAEQQTSKKLGKKAKPKRQRPPSYNPNQARDQRRKEIGFLRGKVAEMEQDLRALQTARGATQVLTSQGEGGSGLENLSAGGVFSTTMWKDMANSQLAQRLRAERENRQLRAVLEGQIKIGKSLQKLLEASATTQ